MEPKCYKQTKIEENSQLHNAIPRTKPHPGEVRRNYFYMLALFSVYEAKYCTFLDDFSVRDSPYFSLFFVRDLRPLNRKWAAISTNAN